jgi:hypothetical protein
MPFRNASERLLFRSFFQSLPGFAARYLPGMGQFCLNLGIPQWSVVNVSGTGENLSDDPKGLLFTRKDKRFRYFL